MSRHLFRRLRRCRALFALALCAWLAMASLAWARQDCCASKGASMSMTMSHASDAQHHAPGQAATATPDCLCAHAAASMPTAVAQSLPHTLPYNAGWNAVSEIAPQPVYEPPLRPPVA
jgi:hypothetical protein